MANEEAWEDLNAFRMTDADAWATIDAAKGCAVTWVRSDGHSLGVWVTHGVLGGERVCGVLAAPGSRVGW